MLHVDAAHPENKLTKTDLAVLVRRVAHGLRNHYGIGANGPNKDVVTVISYGQILVPALFFGIIAAGGVYSAASPSSTPSELARQITQGKSNLVICSSDHKDVATKAAAQSGVPLSRVLVAESWPSRSLKSLERGIEAISDKELRWQSITDPQQLKQSLILILWSSGTTGLPKGVSLSHQNFVAELYIIMVQNRMFVAKLLETDPQAYTPIPYRTVAHLPISHIAGVMGYLLVPIYNAGTVYWMRKYNWSEFLNYAKQYEITALYTVPSIYLRISKSPEVTDHFKHVMAASTGAAPMDGKLQTASNKRLGDGQTTMIGQTWGLSESTGAVTAVPVGQSDTTGCIGFILPNCELRMVDENFRDVEPGQEGELLIRAPVVMQGYFNNEEATRDAFHDFNDDGKGPWFCTGDIAVIRDEKFYIVDRRKELLKYKGLQVAPAEIENLLFTHPAVAEAAVVGVPAPDDPGTDLPRAYVVLEKGQSPQRAAGADASKLDTLSQTRYMDKKTTEIQSGSQGGLEEELKKYVADRLAQHKQLRGGIKFVPEIPKNAIGKFLRKDLRIRAKKEIEVERGTTKAKL